MSYGAGRSVIRLRVGGVHTISSRTGPFLSAFQRVSYPNCSSPDPSKHASQNSTSLQPQGYRTYATRPASRPKAHTGRTTSTTRVKKPTKAEADVGVTVDVKATTGKATKVKAKPKPKPKKKTAVKAKAKRPVKAKAKTAKKPKKPLTEEAKAAAKVKADRAQIRVLKKIALKAPHKKPTSVWNVLCQEYKGTGKSPIGSPEAKEKYRNLIPEETEVRAFHRNL
jgi:hypothetical protein